MPLFLAIVLTIWTGMHAYVVWRLWPFLQPRLGARWTLAAAALLWGAFILGRLLHAAGLRRLGSLVELIGSQWLGVLFLLLCALLVADLATGFGWFFRGHAVAVRGAAALVAVAASLFAFVQAQRAPEVSERTVVLRGLPAELDGTTLVAVSDLHLGSVLGRRFASGIVDQIDALHPDVIAVVGDLLDRDVPSAEETLPELRRLRARFGVFAVTGNHDYYASRNGGANDASDFMRRAGMRVLRDESAAAAPGLTIAGVDDLTARGQYKLDGDPPARALAGAAAPYVGATIYLSHTPWRADEAARLGAGLMICGHTHDGQIWPFRYVSAMRYPLVAGLYEVGGMPVVVGRGTGTWGPRMRLWRRSEILKFTLKSAPPASPAPATR